ncbi:unnamed protein product, partial [Gulo gulo]
SRRHQGPSFLGSKPGKVISTPIVGLKLTNQESHAPLTEPARRPCARIFYMSLI